MIYNLIKKSLYLIKIKTMKTKLILIIVTAYFLTGCAARKRESYSHSSSPNKQFLGGVDRGEKKNKMQSENRIIIYDASLNLKVKNSDSANVHLKEIAEKYEGYAMSMGNRKAEIRVKADKLNIAIKDISEIGKIRNKTIYGNDVTDEYYDNQIRLENARKARQRYLDLLSKAENVEATLKVEKELERLNGDIDSMEGKLNRLTHLSEFSTLTIYLQQRKKLGILGYIGVGLYESVRWLFVRGR